MNNIFEFIIGNDDKILSVNEYVDKLHYIINSNPYHYIDSSEFMYRDYKLYHLKKIRLNKLKYICTD